MGELLRLAITDEETLGQAGDYLHDGEFIPAEIRYDSATSTFTLMIWRETAFHLKWRLFPVSDAWARCRLTLRQVERADIVVEEQKLGSIFLEFAYREQSRTLNLFTAMNVKISLQVAALDGELEDTGEVKSDRKQRSGDHPGSQVP